MAQWNPFTNPDPTLEDILGEPLEFDPNLGFQVPSNLKTPPPLHPTYQYNQRDERKIISPLIYQNDQRSLRKAPVIGDAHATSKPKSSSSSQYHPPAVATNVPRYAPAQAANVGGSSQSNELVAELRRLAAAAEQRRLANQARIDDLYGNLQKRAQQSTQIGRDDPAVRQQADAFSAQAQRATRDYLSDIAERLGPYATGAVTGQSRMAYEKMGQQAAAFEAELMGRELQVRRDEISEALQSMGALLNANQVANLQRELGILDANISKYRTDADTALGYSDIDLRRYGIDTGAKTAANELSLRRYLGDLEAALAREELGFRAGVFETEFPFRFGGNLL